ncbi:efflux RND transporter periplasmic adaptor subunit [Oligoflexus tunisiensis]|uniref:efflux RND transporter periplasmic adaptor subunit n=1 Tax=Oligoflexus tunisiensis TaxID=708132 RepID=UPI000AEEF91B|nr:efflux RND transporter periplasmic adaptor subunit [Oligoflexus tunisiensis]
MTKTWKIVVPFLLGLVLLNVVGIYFWQRSQQPMPEQTTQDTTEKKVVYHCPMHPQITSDKPGQCPICGMDLVKIEDHAEGHDHADNTSVGGRAEFALSEESQQKIGVTSAPVERRSLTQEIRATGRVAYDPELYAAIEEYRQALISREQLKDSSYKGFVDQSAALVKSAATKLKLLGLTEEQIGKIGRGGSNAINLILPEGRVWVYAEVFEYEVRGLKPGQTIEAEAPSIPGETFKGRISSISPVLNAPTRTIRVRAEVPDPKGLLRPDTFLNVRIINDLGEKLAIPEDAVLFNEGQAYVFVKDSTERFQPRPVQLGVKAKGFYEVTSGLSPGENVVTGANFLIDSESRLKSVLMDKNSR